jgi:SAM-dependent methyltransferase
LSTDRLPILPSDRRCRPRALDNPVRRRFAPARRVLDRLGIGPGQTVADLGAGVGYFAPAVLARIGTEGHLFLVEPDASHLEVAAERYSTDARVHLLHSSAAHLDAIPTGSVDRVLLSLVLCCMVDKSGSLDEAWRILRPGGRAYASYPRRGRSVSRRRGSLRVTPERWAALVGAHPWKVLPVGSSWVVVRHLLEKNPGAND